MQMLKNNCRGDRGMSIEYTYMYVCSEIRRRHIVSPTILSADFDNHAAWVLLFALIGDQTMPIDPLRWLGCYLHSFLRHRIICSNCAVVVIIIIFWKILHCHLDYPV